MICNQLRGPILTAAAGLALFGGTVAVAAPSIPSSLSPNLEEGEPPATGASSADSTHEATPVSEMDDRFERSMPLGGASLVWQERRRLRATLDGEQGTFGTAVAMDGSTAVVGAHRHDHLRREQAGAAYVYERPGGAWRMEQRLVAKSPREGDFFGHSVAVGGDTILVGASRHDAAGRDDAGAVYVFERDGGSWRQRQKLAASDVHPHDHFGKTLAIDGNTALVGAPGGLGARPQRPGAAYIFTRDGSEWREREQLHPADALGDEDVHFGSSVDIDGETAVVGARFADRAGAGNVGAAYVFARNGGDWTAVEKLGPDTPTQDQRFGAAVAVEGATLFVGAPGEDGDRDDAYDGGAVRVYSRGPDGWDAEQKLVPSEPDSEGNFGRSLAVDGKMVAVGAPSADRGETVAAGAASVYVRTAGAWRRHRTLEPSGIREHSHNFGTSLALGPYNLVGGSDRFEVGTSSEGRGMAHVFRLACAVDGG